MSRSFVYFLCCSALLFVAACSSSGTSAPSTTQPPYWKTVPAVDLRGKATGTPPEVHVQAGDNTFAPMVLRVDPGVTVVWTNTGAVVHNILKSDTSQDFGGQFGADSLATGATYQFKFASPGVYQYQCTLHTGMVGLVAVGDVNL